MSLKKGKKLCNYWTKKQNNIKKALGLETNNKAFLKFHKTVVKWQSNLCNNAKKYNYKLTQLKKEFVEIEKYNNNPVYCYNKILNQIKEIEAFIIEHDDIKNQKNWLIEQTSEHIQNTKILSIEESLYDKLIDSFIDDDDDDDDSSSSEIDILGSV